MKVGLSTLVENPTRCTGLTSLFREFVHWGLELRPADSWVIFADADYPWPIADPRVEVVRTFTGKYSVASRLIADHLRVPEMARVRSCDVLLSTGFVPLRRSLPVVMQMFSLHHANTVCQLGGMRSLYRRWAASRGVRLAELIITNSEAAASQIVGLYPGSRERVIVSYEGLDHQVFHPRAAPGEVQALRLELGIEPGYFLWVSNFYPYKQAELLLQGYALVRRELRDTAPMVMVGGDWGNGLDSARAIAKDLGITRNVHFSGWVDDKWLAPLYRHAAGFCLASREETFGRSVIEAMACGTPCVVNSIPVMYEVTGGHALIVDFEKPEGVAAALECVLLDHKVVVKLGRAGIANAARFSFEKLAGERLGAIEGILRRRMGSTEVAALSR